MIKLLAECGNQYLVKVEEEKFLLLNLDSLGDYQYAFSPDVFIRFNPYLEPTEDSTGRLAKQIQVLLDSGVFKETEQKMISRDKR